MIASRSQHVSGDNASKTHEPKRQKVKSSKPGEAELPPQAHVRPIAERIEEAKHLRTLCGRKSHAEWSAPAHRRNPIDILLGSSHGRLAHLIPIRYGRMVSSPFAFYRGAAAIMASDLSYMPNTGVRLQICGDCHLMNFGGFATPERQLVFDINDFDETAVGPWEWDVKRLVASMVVAAQSNGFHKDDAKDIAWHTASSYRDNLVKFGEMPILDAWYEQLDLLDIVDNITDSSIKKLAAAKIKKASENTAHTKEFVKLAVADGYPPRIRDEPPLIYHDATTDIATNREELQQIFEEYRKTIPSERLVLLDRFKAVDAAVKVVGVGSVGTYCGIVLMVSGSGDPLFLQFKQAAQSVVEPYAGASPYKHHGQRVVVGQRLMQSASDIFLGWTQGPRGHFYLRQLRDAKVSADITLMKASNLRNYGLLCARALARAHARTGDAMMLGAYLGKSDAFPDALTVFAMTYAEQNERDYQLLVNAIRKGHIEATSLE